MKVYCSYFIFACVIYKSFCTTTKYFTFEEDAPGTEIGNLSLDLKMDPAEDPETSFKFMQKTNPSVIHMRQIDGLLTVGETIDRELLCHRSPQCLVTFDVVAFSKGKFQLIHVEIEIKDINDHAPWFARNETHMEISEDAPLRARFPLDIAVDRDVGDNYIQSYQITHTNHFAVEVSTQEDGSKCAELVMIKTLDRETEEFYTIEVTATDGGAPPKSGSTTVYIRVLDSNDNSPTFEHNSLKVELNEDSPVGTRVLKVHAFDSDAGINGEVIYGFVEGSPSDVTRVFQIDLISGEVTLKDAVDYEKKKSYEFHIQASDLGTNSVSSTCRAIVDIVDVNDNAPEINIKPMTSTSDGVAFITEAAAVESFVALVSTSDSDSGTNGYVRTSLRGHEHFKLQQAYSDTFMIVTTATLDRETISEYNLTVVAEDFGTPPFKTVTHYTIRITDENDNAPAFSKNIYDVSVIENNIPGSYITTVVARDLDTGKNGKVSYSLVEGKTPDGAALSTFVSIDPVSGSLYTLRSFNFEAFKQVQFTVKATDKGSLPLYSTALVRIHVVDANDNSPYFTYPVLRNHTADIPIPLNAQRGYLALRVTAQDEDDGDNSDLSFHILENDAQLFFMDKKSGEIVLRQSLTASCGDVLQVRVSVVDKGREPLSSTATIRFVVTDTGSQEDQVVILLRSKDEETLSFDIGTVVIVAFTGGCVLLLTAVGILAVTCNRRRSRRNYGRDGLYGSSPFSKSDTVTSDIYGGTGAFLPNEGDSAHHCLYEDKSLDFEEKLFLPCKPFEQTFLWQDEKYCLQRSGTSNTDQLSVKDSGKGDSDFNDSDSDTSAAALKRSLTTFQPVSRSSFTRVGDWQGKQRVIQTQNMHVPPGAAYTIGFSAPAYNMSHVHSHPWKEGFNKTNKLQTFSRTGALPSNSLHPLGGMTDDVEEQTEPVKDVLTVSAVCEVATTF
ncbi:protocadherin-8 [Triplophysa dalaica]|uniref:protocadherin-8 n=1 Tax=Triplophysa dalaica TaxID=1582913 RepID=UPI0024E03F26|nr:protocadherin-8 [Triplophysa dalaica]